MPTIVGILTFMSRINFVLSWVEYGKGFITSGPVWDIFSTQILHSLIFLFILHVKTNCGAHWRVSPNISASAQDFNTYHIREQGKALGSLCTFTDLPETYLLVYMKYGCRWRLRPKFRPLALLDMSAWTFILVIWTYVILKNIKEPKSRLFSTGPYAYLKK